MTVAELVRDSTDQERPTPSAGAPDLSIVIPVFNKCELTRNCLASIDRHTTRRLHWEVIVVDNASTDETSAYLKDACRLYPWLRIVQNQTNVGFARASNQGARASTAPAILFLNNDTEVLPGWLEPLFRTLYCDSSVGAVGAKLLFPDQSVQHAGVYIGDHRGTGDPFVALHNHYKRPREHPLVDVRSVYTAVTAACMLVRRSVFDEVSGFDEQFWNGYEDVDFCLQIGERGWYCVYEPECEIIHHESQSGPERYRRVQDNIQRLHSKWRSKRNVDFIIHPNGRSELVRPNAIQTLRLPAELTFDRVLQDLRNGRSSDISTSIASVQSSNDSFNVVLIAPEGYEHSLAFLEVGELLVESFRSLGKQARLQQNRLDPASTNVILGYNLLPNGEPLRPVRHILVQLEQLSMQEGWFRPDRIEMLRRADAVWDYASENVEFLRRRGLTKVRHLPIGYHDNLRRIVRQNQDIDVLFYGSLNHRRRFVLEQIGKFATVKCLVGVYGQERDDYIARSKIVVNLHFYESQIMEQARIAYLLNNRCFVVSEASKLNPFGATLVTCEYDRVVETVQHYLANPCERYQKAKEAHCAFRERPMMDYLREVLPVAGTLPVRHRDV